MAIMKTRTLIPALILLVFSVGQTFAANKVVVIPLFDGPASGGGVMVIPAFAFIPEDDSDDYRFYHQGYIIAGNLSTQACFYAPVYLPNGVTISRYEAIVTDSSNTTGRILTSLRTLNLKTGASINMGEANTTASGSPGFVTIFNENLDPALVDAVNNTYFMTLCVTSNAVSIYSTRFYGARILYQ
jgi:hypothetical protein